MPENKLEEIVIGESRGNGVTRARLPVVPVDLTDIGPLISNTA